MTQAIPTSAANTAPTPGAPVAVFSVAARLNRLPVLPAHRRITAVIGLGLFFDLYEVFLAGVLSATLVRDFHVTAGRLPWILSSAFLGAFLGACVLPLVADRIGRRTAFLTTLALYSAASLAGAFSPTLLWLVIARFVAGIGIGAELPVADTYLADLLPERVRGRFIAVAYTVAFCGVPVVGLLGRTLATSHLLGLEGWRWLLVAGSLGAVAVAFVRRALPESPRWLEAVGRHDEAARITAELEHQAARRGPLAPPRHDIDPAPRLPIRALLRRPLARNTALMGAFQTLQTFGYYGFGSLAPLVLTAKGYSVVGSLGYTAAAYLGYPIGSLLSLPLIERVERKWLITGSALLMAALGLGYALAASPVWLVLAGLAYTMVSNVFSNAFHVYQTELFPTSVRAVATGSAYAMSRLSTAAMPFVLVPLLHNAGTAWVFTVSAAAMVTVALVIAAFGPATNARPLEGIATPADRPRPLHVSSRTPSATKENNP
ncbi:MFS transporter [Streptacidiphilus rugosus]|uniref:MFS transporter n=1 Tax=Streptacidiphilus rugosus TaxID=405783 RepID=UPI000A05C730|nr:MFS transporter [Streptacidiphilus rugosus]